MSDDLISRKAEIERVNNTTFSNNVLENRMIQVFLRNFLNASKSVYDVEKVLELLEKCRDIMFSPVSENCFGVECKHNDCTVCAFEKRLPQSHWL